MKTTLKIFKLLPFIFILVGCPLFDQGMCDIDTPLYVRNIHADTIHITRWAKTLSTEGDSLLTIEDVHQIYLFENNPSTIFSIASMEINEVPGICERGAKESPQGIHYYLANIDTLLKYTPETWDRIAGLKRYYFYHYSDYEQINFTMEFP